VGAADLATLRKVPDDSGKSPFPTVDFLRNES